MASFCNQCASALSLHPGDFNSCTTHEEWSQGKAAIVLCEGCGPIQVDPYGNCISTDCMRPGHGGRPYHACPWCGGSAIVLDSVDNIPAVKLLECNRCNRLTKVEDLTDTIAKETKLV